MSTRPRRSRTEEPVDVPPPSHFAARADRGDEQWIEDAIEAYLDLTLGPKQRAICRSVVANEQTAVVGANGTGKTYITGAIALVWQTVRYPAITFGTSGTGKKLYRTLCRPIDKLHGAALGGAGLPGEFKQQPPRIDYDDPEHFFEAASPKDAGELEGAHSAYTLAIIEETDKDDVTAETVDAMRSLIPEWETSRMLAVGNPPEDETDVFADLIEDRSPWHVIRVSSFDSYNVLVETSQADGDLIEGMATLSTLKKDWRDYHDEAWPGIEQARAWSDPEHPAFRDDLHARWYRRRAGVIPPANAAVHRPIEAAAVKAAWERDPGRVRETPTAVGIDVARSGDRTVMAGLYDTALRLPYDEPGANHVEQFEGTDGIWECLDEWPQLAIAIDAVGQGAGYADKTAQRYPDVHQFNNGGVASDDEQYFDCWAEGLALLGAFLEAGGSIDDRALREELLVVARSVAFEERHYASRDTEVLVATGKDVVKDRLGRSPDRLDAALMAVWAADEETGTTQRASPIVSW